MKTLLILSGGALRPAMLGAAMATLVVAACMAQEVPPPFIIDCSTRLSIHLVGASAQLSWNSSPGTLYQVQAGASLGAGNWPTVASIVAADHTTSWSDPSPLTSSRFYQLTLPNGLTTLYEPPRSEPAAPCDCATCGNGAPGAALPFVHLFSGELHLGAEDLRIKGRGLDFVWARAHRSRVGPNTA